jgi:anhydro-N-acetylmuramic acid kinase
MSRPRRLALGLMSGTSLDGIDVAVIETDAEKWLRPGPFQTYPYENDLRARLRGVLGGVGPVAEVERAITLAHAEAVRRFLADFPIPRPELIGFHGHTILHRPEERCTWQIGDGALLAAETGVDVVCDFRSADVAAGGQGAPLVPIFHRAFFERLPTPLAILNIGGVANVTWVGGEESLTTAFDTGPGNALIDDWILEKTGERFDADGAIAASGRVDQRLLEAWLRHPYFARPAPKSLDRDDFAACRPEGLSVADGAATLTAFTAAAVGAQLALLPEPPRQWLVTGGGRRNRTLMDELQRRLGVAVRPVEDEGADGDAFEAQAFAYLAVRSVEGLPLSFPRTTGAPAPMTGGRLFRAR